MTGEETRLLYRRMAALYRLRGEDIDPMEIVEWQELFVSYSFEGMSRALTTYVEQYVTAPKPAHLLRLYKDYQHRQWEEAVNRQTAAYVRGKAEYRCNYCEDRGFIFIDNSLLYPPGARKCFCRFQDPSAALQRFLDAGWVLVNGVWVNKQPLTPSNIDTPR